MSRRSKLGTTRFHQDIRKGLLDIKHGRLLTWDIDSLEFSPAYDCGLPVRVKRTARQRRRERG